MSVTQLEGWIRYCSKCISLFIFH